ncbi:MAG: DUF362 domain-containing protein [Synergistaceae bacterium]|nr:DUF362 domain-containing protein [Synergistaceae bacterium]
MDRREFLKKMIALGIGTGAMFMPGGLKRMTSPAFGEREFPDLVAVKGGSAGEMFDRGMKAIGGIGRFVRKGQNVVIKPNISWDVPANGAANTSPELVAGVIKHCLDAGAGKVFVMDHSIEYWENSSKNSGIGDAIKGAGGIYVPSDGKGYYQAVPVKGSALKETMVHESILECDVLISVPVLKHHGGAGVSISSKGLMGCVWNRRDYHAQGLQRCIADFLSFRKPDLNIIDAVSVITKNGPRGGSPSDVVNMGSLVISPDVVAADTAGAMMLGHKQGGIEHIRLAAGAGLGEMDLSKLRIERITL